MRCHFVIPRITFFVLISLALTITLAAEARAAGKEVALYRFAGGTDGGVPTGSLLMDSAGNLYGTTSEGGSPNPHCKALCGTVFELVHSGTTWTKTIIYSFAGDTDGYFPMAGLVLDKKGNLYGTTYFGGAQFAGTVFELKHTNGRLA